MSCLKEFVLFIFLTLFVFITPLSAGVYFESEIHSSIDPEVQKSETFVSGAKMKNVINDSYGWMIDLKEGKILDFDLKSGTYYELSLEQMSEELDAVGVQAKIFSQLFVGSKGDEQIAKELEDDPDELNAFGKSKPPMGKEIDQPFEPFLKKVKKKKKILDYDCSLVQVDMAPNERQEFWITNQISYGQEVLNFWKAFYRLSSTSIKKFDPLKKQFKVMSMMDGFVLNRKTQIQAGTRGSFEEEEKVVFVEDRQISDKVFELPQDIKKIDPPAGGIPVMQFQRKDSTI